jgi:uncharacterized protein (DUF885 family)
MSVVRRSRRLVCALALSVFANALVAQEAAPAPQQALAQLFADSDEAALAMSPISAMLRGDMRYADQFGDYISDDYHARIKANTERELQRLAAIDRNALGRDERIAYDVFRYQGEQLLSQYRSGLMDIVARMPIDHFQSMHVFYPELSSGTSAIPFATLQDYENGVSRLQGYVRYLDRAIVRMREGIASGHTQPRLVMENVLAQLTAQMQGGVDASPFFAPLLNWPQDIAPAERQRIETAYRSVIGEGVFGAYRRLQDFINAEYLAACRSEVPGLLSMKDGDALYQGAIESYTTTTMSAAEIHALGLSEVARIRAAMHAIQQQVGFEGSQAEFFEFLRSDPRFVLESRQALLDGYEAIGKRVAQRIPEFFTLVPKSPLEIRPVPDYLEQTDAAGSYRQGTPDGSQPGVFFVNTWDLPSRGSLRMETLYLHEAIPGHHFQVSLAQENEALPNFLRFGDSTAFVEGWALYAESLGKELGMFTDPYQQLGSLDDEMLRAMRLVVDTGLHAKGWARDQALQYMLDNSAVSVTEATAEVERYIAMPGQALAYKIGALTIRRLRNEAEAALGDRFDVRQFHAQVLDTGALPLAVLELKIRAWIEQRGAAS